MGICWINHNSASVNLSVPTNSDSHPRASILNERIGRFLSEDVGQTCGHEELAKEGG